jgi:signal transduction histidine kinase
MTMFPIGATTVSVMRTWAKHHHTQADALGAVALFLLVFLGPYVNMANGRLSGRVVLAGAFSYLPMAWIRRYTIPVAIIVMAATVYASTIGHINQLGLLWALFVVGWKLNGRALYLVAGGMISFTVSVLFIETSPVDPRMAWLVLAGVVLFSSPVLCGRMVCNLNERTASAERELGLRAELYQHSIARVGSEERIRLARELHDAVAHSMSVVVLHAAGAQRALVASPELARASMQTVEETARQSLMEMRRLVTTLRVDPSELELSPQPGINEVGALIQVHPSASLAILGESRIQSAIIDTSIYRIVQESLTNARRHAPGSPVAVLIEHSERAVIVSVRNSIPKAAIRHESGYGLVGMMERVKAVGGYLRAGPNESGEWEVRAELPVDAPYNQSLRTHDAYGLSQPTS